MASGFMCGLGSRGEEKDERKEEEKEGGPWMF